MEQALDLIGEILGALLGGAGFLVLGVAISWLAWTIYRTIEKPWYARVILFFLFPMTLLVSIWKLPLGISGAYALGAGIGLLFFGLWQPNQSAKFIEESDEKE